MYQLKHKGFSLIEVLVTLLVLAVGLLSVAALQIQALRFNHDGYLRTIAVMQTYEMVDRMRANKAGVANGNYDSVSGVGTNPVCSSCTSAQIAQRDANRWNTANGNLLPSGQGTVTKSGNLFLVTVRWDAFRTGATGTGCGGDPSVDLTCFTVGAQL